MRTLKFALLAGLVAISSGCTSDDYQRTDGLAFGAGNAMAANTVMQMVDPWQNGVQNTKLRVPAARGPQPGAADDAAATKTYQGTTTNN